MKSEERVFPSLFREKKEKNKKIKRKEAFVRQKAIFLVCLITKVINLGASLL